MKWKPLLVILILISMFSPVVRSIGPTHVYVDDNYNSGTPGWGTTHFDNIQDGINAVNSGGTVTVYAGTYSSFSANKEVILAGVDRDTVIVDGGGSGVVVNFTVDNITMSGFTIQDGDTGIELNSDWNNISRNIIQFNENGILFVSSDNNTIFYNDLINNTYGMDLFSYDDFYNLIYNNNFLNCTAIDDHPGFEDTYNRWNETYGTFPDDIIGGNYWYDNLDFTDEKYGPEQDISGADGICDNSYTCGRSGVDYYPYVEWIYPPGDEPPVLSDEEPENGSGLIDPSIPEVMVTITDSGTFDWTIEGEYLITASDTGDSTGIKTATVSETLPSLTLITWYVNVTDGTYTVNATYMFSTSGAGETTLQEIIDGADEGDHIVIPAGTYTENFVIDKPMTLEGANPITTILDGGGIGTVVEINASGVVFEGFTVQNSGSPGIYVHDVSDVEVKNNIVKDNGDGIYFLRVTNSLIQTNHIFRNTINGIYCNDCQEITIDTNNISGNSGLPWNWRENGNRIGAYLTQCSDCSIITNKIQYNDFVGLSLTLCDYCTVYENDIWRNGDSGIEATTNNAYNTYTRNTIHENEGEGIWLENEVGAIVSQNDIWDNSLSGIRVFMYSDNVSIGGNKFHENWQFGIDLWGASDCNIFMNNCSGNDVAGIRLYWKSERNEIYENDFIGYAYLYHLPNYQPLGALIDDSGAPGFEPTDNKIYHNTFDKNINEIKDERPVGANEWDDGYPSGGNYYEIFHNNSQGAFDVNHGALQNQNGSDGIIDIAYHGLANAVDNYPLRNSYRIIELAKSDFTWSPEFPKPQGTVTFTALTDPNIKQWFWNFGDGTTGRKKTEDKLYLKPGFYVVSLRVVSNHGLEDTSIKRVYVTPLGVFIPEPQPPKYPGYTVQEMYDLMHATDLQSSKSVIKIMVIDSGVMPKKYKDFDLSTIISEHSPSWADGIDLVGHGTWCNYAVGYIVKSKLPNAKQISYRIFGPEATTSNDILIAALDTAEREGVDVVSLSVGAIGNPHDSFCQKVEELNRNGIIVVCAAGNFGPYASTILSPGCSIGAFSVAAEDPQWYGDILTPERRAGILNLNDDMICEFSSRGPVPNIYPKPDIAAPGESILGPWVSKGEIVEKALSGTSMATPLVAGGVSVIVAQNKDLIEQVKFLHFWDKSVIVTALEDSIRESAYRKGGVNEWGAGIVQFDKVSKLYTGKLQGVIFTSFIIDFSLPILLIILLIVLYILSRRNKKPWWARGK